MIPELLRHLKEINTLNFREQPNYKVTLLLYEALCKLGLPKPIANNAIGKIGIHTGAEFIAHPMHKAVIDEFAHTIVTQYAVILGDFDDVDVFLELVKGFNLVSEDIQP